MTAKIDIEPSKTHKNFEKLLEPTARCCSPALRKVEVCTMTDREPDIGTSQASLPPEDDDPSPVGDGAPTAARAPASENAVAMPEGRAVPPTNAGDERGVVVGGFDYGQVAPDLASHMRATATSIRKRMNDAVVENGLELLVIKDRIKYREGPGHWLEWIRAELDISVSTADRMMEIARIWKETNSSALKILPKDTLLAIAEAPKPIRDQALALLEEGKPISAIAIRQQSHEHRDEEKAAVRRRKPTPEKVKRDAQRKTRKERQLQVEQEARKKKEEQERDAAQQIVKLLADQIEDLPALIDLFEASDVAHSRLVKLMREYQPASRPPGHVPPPAIKAPSAQATGDGQAGSVPRGHINGADRAQATPSQDDHPPGVTEDECFREGADKTGRPVHPLV
jgi:hypothetical protein